MTMISLLLRFTGGLLLNFVTTTDTPSLMSGKSISPIPRKIILSVKLFHKNRSQPIWVEHGSSIELSRCVVPVPAYAAIKIGVGLISCETEEPIVGGYAKFEAKDFGTYEKDIKLLKGQGYVARVLVHWNHIDRVYQENMYENFHALSITRSPSAARASLASPLMEIFSVFVDRENDDILDLSGTIKVAYSVGECTIFKRELNKPQELSPCSKTIATTGHYECFLGTELGIKVDLKDVQDCLAIKGCVGWNDFSLEVPISWFDRGICSVIRGEHGYAALHYTIFSAAVQAKVEVNLLPKGSEIYADVYGTLIASYSNYSYSTEYESKYYRAVLLDKHKDDVLELRGSSEIPLTRHVVAVPFQSFLMIEVNLNACSISSVDDDAFDGYPNSQAYRSLQTTAALKANFSGKSSFSFEGGSYGICISVEWGRRYIT